MAKASMWFATQTKFDSTQKACLSHGEKPVSTKVRPLQAIQEVPEALHGMSITELKAYFKAKADG